MSTTPLPLSELERQAKEAAWREEYAEFIAAYNKQVEREGLLLARWRLF